MRMRRIFWAIGKLLLPALNKIFAFCTRTIRASRNAALLSLCAVVELCVLPVAVQEHPSCPAVPRTAPDTPAVLR